MDLLEPRVARGVSIVSLSSLDTGTTHPGIATTLLAMSCDKNYNEGHLSIGSSGKLGIWGRLLGSINPEVRTFRLHQSNNH